LKSACNDNSFRNQCQQVFPEYATWRFHGDTDSSRGLLTCDAAQFCGRIPGVTTQKISPFITNLVCICYCCTKILDVFKYFQSTLYTQS
jgi:hypothetical protein